MNCHYCLTPFTPNHGNERFCTDECREYAQRVYMRGYQKRRRGKGKKIYRISKVGNRYFFVLPTRYKNFIINSQFKWYVSFQKDFESILITISLNGGISLCPICKKQYRIYLEESACIRLNAVNTYTQLGVTFSISNDRDMIIAIIKT